MHISKALELIALLSTMSLGVFHVQFAFSLSISYIPWKKQGKFKVIAHSLLICNQYVFLVLPKKERKKVRPTSCFSRNLSQARRKQGLQLLVPPPGRSVDPSASGGLLASDVCVCVCWGGVYVSLPASVD